MSGERFTEHRRTTRQDFAGGLLRGALHGVQAFARGEVLTAEKLNRLIRQANAAGSVAQPLQRNGDLERTVGVYEARVLAEGADFLVCELFEGGDNAQEVLVGKPYALRRSPNTSRGGVSFTYDDEQFDKRTVSVNGKTFTQWITPGYVPRGWPGGIPDIEANAGIETPGDIIYVTNQIVGPTTLFEGTFDLQGNSGVEHWLDLNVDGRTWAGDLQEIDEPGGDPGDVAKGVDLGSPG